MQYVLSLNFLSSIQRSFTNPLILILILFPCPYFLKISALLKDQDCEVTKGVTKKKNSFYVKKSNCETCVLCFPYVLLGRLMGFPGIKNDNFLIITWKDQIRQHWFISVAAPPPWCACTPLRMLRVFKLPK